MCGTGTGRKAKTHMKQALYDHRNDIQFRPGRLGGDQGGMRKEKRHTKNGPSHKNMLSMTNPNPDMVTQLAIQ